MKPYNADFDPCHHCRVPQPRGVGIKIFNVEGEKLRPDGKDPKTQDFEFNSSPVLELANATTCRDIIALRLQHGCPAALDGALKKRDDYEVQDARNRGPLISLLAQRQYSQSAFRYGDYVAKFALIPTKATAEASGGYDHRFTPSDGEHHHKNHMSEFYKNNTAEWDFQVQLLSRSLFEDYAKSGSNRRGGDLLEDARIDWPQDKYPYITVAKVRCQPQDAFNHKRVSFWEDRIRVDPWHGLVVHKPLGSINRVRKGVYKASSTFRRRLNGTTEVTVSSIDEIPDS